MLRGITRRDFMKGMAISGAAVGSAGLLAACGSSTSDSGSQESQTQNSSETQASSSEEQTASASEFTYPMDTDVTLTYWCELNNNVSANFASLGDTPFGQQWQEETGVTIEFQHPPANQGSEQFSLLLADGDLPDMMEYAWMSFSGGPEKAIQDGVIYELTDIINAYCPNLKAYLEENPDIDKMVKTDEGHYYCFPFIRGDERLCNTIGLMLRQDWLEELNMEVPTTIDEWHDVLVAFRDEMGAESPFSWEYTMGSLTDANPFAYAYGTCRGFYLGEDGTVHYGPAEEGFKQYLELFNQWYAEKLLDQDLATLALDQVSAKITSGKAGAAIGWAGSRMGTWLNAAIQTNPDYMLVCAPYPTINKGDTPQMGQIDNRYPNQGCVAITTSCKDVEAAARLLDYAYSDAGHMLFNFGIEGESYEMIDDYPTYTDLVMDNPEGWSVAQSLSAYIRGNYNGPFVQDIRYLEQYYTYETQKESAEIWGATNASKYKVPPITPTTDESKEYSTIMSEINTYRDEMSLKFILGDESLDNFDKFVETLYDLGLERALEIQNAALDRYNAR
ncbi:MAG: substrate-binding domain-containing protein [Lachnospiraceae bacterium]|nr:substrate-binding domain-containing protein [Lachnospiraceae bacterium]